MKAIFQFFKKYYAFLALLLAFLASAYAIVSQQAEHFASNIEVIRIGHWQLEAGVRSGFKKLAEKYQDIHPNVRVIQDAVPESVYGQWLSTQFMGETAPDIVQMGMLPYQRLVAYYNRYCLPLTEIVNRPNPYNKNNEFADIPLRQTFKDGMRPSYIQEVQEYMSIPLSQFSTRVFYNKQLLKKLTGRDNPPRTYRDFYNVCSEVKKHKNAKGQDYIPIVGSIYHFNHWVSALCDIMTYPVMYDADYNYDGYVSVDELFASIKSGALSFHSEPIAARFKMIRELADFCQPGFTGLARDDGVFLFVQQRAVFISTGTWDAGSLVDQAAGEFDVGVIDFPFPTKDDPEFKDVVLGPRYENPGSAFAFSVTRSSKYPQTAIDFLLFLSSKENNEFLNDEICWIPAVSNTKKPNLLKDFEPNLRGTYVNFNMYLGGETWIKWEQMISLYYVNQVTYDDFVNTFEPFYKDHGVADYQEMNRDWRRSIWNDERMISGLRMNAVTNDGKPGGEARWGKYHYQCMSRLLLREISQARLMSRVSNDDKSYLAVCGPYRTPPEIRAMLKEELRKTMNDELKKKGAN